MSSEQKASDDLSRSQAEFESRFTSIKIDGVPLSRDDLALAYRAFQKFDKDGSGAIDTKVTYNELKSNVR